MANDSCYKIEGTIQYIEREKFPCPNDGVHVVGKNGAIKGVHSLWLTKPDGEKVLFPKGQVCFYWRLNEDRGLRVFYSFGWFKAQKEDYVKKIFRKHRKLAKAGIAPEVYDVVKVRLDLEYPREGKSIHKDVWAYEVQHVHYPKKIWEMYAKGYPYKWVDIDHAEHSSSGFIEWRKSMWKQLKKMGIKIDGSGKLGDIAYDTKKRRWYLVDID